MRREAFSAHNMATSAVENTHEGAFARRNIKGPCLSSTSATALPLLSSLQSRALPTSLALKPNTNMNAQNLQTLSEQIRACPKEKFTTAGATLPLSHEFLKVHCDLRTTSGQQQSVRFQVYPTGTNSLMHGVSIYISGVNATHMPDDIKKALAAAVLDLTKPENKQKVLHTRSIV